MGFYIDVIENDGYEETETFDITLLQGSTWNSGWVSVSAAEGLGDLQGGNKVAVGTTIRLTIPGDREVGFVGEPSISTRFTAGAGVLVGREPHMVHARLNEPDKGENSSVDIRISAGNTGAWGALNLGQDVELAVTVVSQGDPVVANPLDTASSDSMPDYSVPDTLTTGRIAGTRTLTFSVSEDITLLKLEPTEVVAPKPEFLRVSTL